MWLTIGRRVFEELCHLQRCGDADTRVLAGAAIEVASTMVAKAGRIAGYDGPDDPVWFEDAVPNLMLIERLLDSVESSLEALRSRLRQPDLERLDRAYAGLRRELDGHLRAIPQRARSMLLMLASEGRAPSPFCTVGT